MSRYSTREHSGGVRGGSYSQRVLCRSHKLSDKRLGLLINFNVALIKEGIIRVVNGLKE
jgi:hypothetical protein